MNFSKAFHSDLERAYTCEVPVPVDAFFTKLRWVLENDSYNDASIEDLEALGGVLKTWSNESDAALEKQLRNLSRDHPVKCPVSLFGTMNFGRLEVAHTRSLAWLLNPDAEHGFGPKMIEALMRRLPNEKKLLRVQVNKVEAEHPYKNLDGEDSGRIDVWVEGSVGGSPWLLVIEAKIDSPEEEQQLGRYDKEIDRWRKRWPTPIAQVTRVFLTREGTDRDIPNWNRLSFSELARVMWSAADSLKTKPGYHFLRFYIAGVLRDVLELPVGKIDHQYNRFKLLGFLARRYTNQDQ